MFGKHYFSYGVWWKEPTIKKLKKLRNLEYWDDPMLYLKTFLDGDFEDLRGNMNVLDLPIMKNIINICIAGASKGKAKTENVEIKSAIEQRIAKRKEKALKQGLISQDEVEPSSSDNDLLWIATILMKSDASQPYESIMNMTLSEVFGVFDRLKAMNEKREKNKGKKPSGKKTDITKLNIPTLGGKND